MAYASLSTSPRKVVPLNGGLDMQRTKSDAGAASAPTRRAYFCAVVVEGGQDGQPLAQEVQEVVASLGDPMSLNDNKTGIERSTSAPNVLSTSLADLSNNPPEGPRKRSMTTSSELQDVINELVNTERSYVARLRMLQTNYAEPLRAFARSKESAILPAYEAKILFGNIDSILPANEAFLEDLEKMVSPNGPKLVGGIGDVALKHLKEYGAFECYKQYYAKREEAQTIFEKEMAKKSNTGFAGFIDRIKYSTVETKNRVGLRELLMDPVQRIPRYTLMFRTMIKHMSPADPQRQKLIEADEIASKIALAETDDQTKRATIMYCLERSIEGFPANLISHGRRFIDCIDVEDLPVESPASNRYSHVGDSSAMGLLHCTLFLFDDCLLIVKRPSGAASGKVLSGLEEVERVSRLGGLPTGVKKGVMSCKGVMDVTEVVATDNGGPDFHLYLEQPPDDQSERWSRSFRSLAIVHPPHPPNFDPILAKTDKQRFLQNLWTAQALYRVKSERSVALASEDMEMNSGRAGRPDIVRTYYNVYQRVDWLREPKKCKIVLHIDAMGSAEPLPFGEDGPPFVIARAQPMAGELCRYTVTSSDPTVEGEADIVHNATLPSRVVQTIHQFGLFKFRTSKGSAPSTPTASRASKSAIFGLDAISRNLFNASTSLKTGDVFGIGSLSSSRRGKSSSRASVYTIGTEGSAGKFSSRSNSTAGTSVSLMDDENRGSRKLTRRGRSPGPGSAPDSGNEYDSRDRPVSRVGSIRQKSARYGDPETNPAKSGAEDESGEEMEVDRSLSVFPRSKKNASDRHLDHNLALARQNSQSQETAPPAFLGVKRKMVPIDTRDADVIMEESRSTGAFSTLAQNGSVVTDLASHLYSPSVNSREAESITPTPTLTVPGLLSPTKSRTSSINGDNRSVRSRSMDRRPMGPRARSPDLRAEDIEAALQNTLDQLASRPLSPALTGSSMISRQPSHRSYRPTTPSDHSRPESPWYGHRPVTPTSMVYRPTTPTGGHRPKTPSKELPPIPSIPPSARVTTQEIERARSPSPFHRPRPYDAIDKTPQPRPQSISLATPRADPIASLEEALARTPSRPLPAPTPSVPPLSIKKKTSIRRSSPPPSARKSIATPLVRDPHTRRQSNHVQNERAAAADAAMQDLEDVASALFSEGSMSTTTKPSTSSSFSQLTTVAASTRDDITSSRRCVKRIRLEVDNLKTTVAKDLGSKDKGHPRLAASTTTSIPRSPHFRQLADKEKAARMEEMRRMISARGGVPPSAIPVPPSSIHASSASSSAVELPWLDEWTRKVEEHLAQADQELQKASSDHELLFADLKQLVTQFEEKTNEVERTKGELRRAKKQCELVKKLLADATTENEIMYEAFNEELDGMFNDAGLPESDAWDTLTRDLCQTKDARNTLAKENASLKRKLEEAELQSRQWEELLRSHGLIA